MSSYIDGPGYIFYNKIIPEGCYPLWNVSNEEYHKIIMSENRSINPYCHKFFKPIEYIDTHTLLGNIGIPENIDSNSLENENGIVPTRAILLENYPKPWEFFKDHFNNKNVYFTFDQITLWKLINVNQSKPLQLTLRRIEGKKIIKKNTAFMIMPFHNSTLDSLYLGIKDFLKTDTEMKIDLKRADEFLENDIIVKTIYREIAQSEFIIAETTFNNKNVFYEIGYAAALSKEIISIQDFCISERPFFDRSHIRFLDYHRETLESFYKELKNTIIAIRMKP